MSVFKCKMCGGAWTKIPSMRIHRPLVLLQRNNYLKNALICSTMSEAPGGLPPGVVVLLTL